ncbi:MAG TPA: type II CAAX endopeptidase family protein [Longimicrobiales bacterium]|nr:type II CAAX endopeptidase family protein [Longimicrobiales bacterium]
MILRIAGAVLTVIAFNLIAMFGLAALPPVAGLVWVLALAAAFYAWSTRPGRRRRQRLSRLRVRPPAAPLRWVLLSCAATILLLLAIGSFASLIAPELDASDIPEWYDMLRPYRETTIGWVALTLLIAFAIPLVEEFSFRGHVQRLLERRYGVPVAIVASAILFMSLHVGVPHWSILGISLTLGLAAGLAVHVFRSIWPAVLMHCAWNGSMIGAEAIASRIGTEYTAGATANAVSGLALLALGALGWRRVLVAVPGRVLPPESPHPSVTERPA